MSNHTKAMVLKMQQRVDAMRQRRGEIVLPAGIAANAFGRIRTREFVAELARREGFNGSAESVALNTNTN